MKAWRKVTKVCQEATQACLGTAKTNVENIKIGLKEIEAVADVFERSQNKLDTTDLEAIREVPGQ
jgi:hypothetical protein